MPPRTPSVSVAISALARPFGAASLVTSSTPRCLVAVAGAAASSGVWNQSGLQPSTRTTAGFSTTANRQGLSRLRRRFIQWKNKHGSRYRNHIPGQTNYLEMYQEKAPTREERLNTPPTNKPFPINPLFVSTPVLDDTARELIWRKIMKEGESIKAVSALYGVDIRRVAAIVRLKEVEKDWESRVKHPPLNSPFIRLYPRIPKPPHMMIANIPNSISLEDKNTWLQTLLRASLISSLSWGHFSHIPLTGAPRPWFESTYR